MAYRSIPGSRVGVHVVNEHLPNEAPRKPCPRCGLMRDVPQGKRAKTSRGICRDCFAVLSAAERAVWAA